MSSGVERERLGPVWVSRVADETTCGVGVEAEHEEEREMMGVPECFEALGANFMVGRGVPS